jgi:hypothetical protein
MVLKKLTTAQKNKLSKHKAHHTEKHMKSMKASMMSGKSFVTAHKDAMKKVGK